MCFLRHQHCFSSWPFFQLTQCRFNILNRFRVSACDRLRGKTPRPCQCTIRDFTHFSAVSFIFPKPTSQGQTRATPLIEPASNKQTLFWLQLLSPWMCLLISLIAQVQNIRTRWQSDDVFLVFSLATFLAPCQSDRLDKLLTHLRHWKPTQQGVFPSWLVLDSGLECPNPKHHITREHSLTKVMPYRLCLVTLPPHVCAYYITTVSMKDVLLSKSGVFKCPDRPACKGQVKLHSSLLSTPLPLLALICTLD